MSWALPQSLCPMADAESAPASLSFATLCERDDAIGVQRSRGRGFESTLGVRGGRGAGE